jgi:glycosyltransferase involved in cell wall biosynthesis
MSCPQPLLGEVGVIALVPDQWGPHWETRHHVLSRLARYFHVVWMNYPPGWRNWLSAWRERRVSPADSPATPPGLQIYQPELLLPNLGRPAWLARLAARQRLKRARARLLALGCTKLVLYLWRPEFAGAREQLPHDFSIYHIDDEYSFSSADVEISPAERRLLESAGQVFIHSPALMQKKGAFNPKTEFVPNGVDYSSFSTPMPEPEDLRPIPHPRIGYVGHLKRQVDWSLLLELSAVHSQWSFVFVGPRRPHAEIDGMLEQMSRRPNVYFLGGKPTLSLCGYPQHFDACIMPYQLDEYTKYIYPLKMHEYLASGKPVVSSPIRSVEEFRHVIEVASTREEWSNCLEHALSEEQNTPDRRCERQAVARDYDWDPLVFRIARTIAANFDLNIADVAAICDSRSSTVSVALL